MANEMHLYMTMGGTYGYTYMASEVWQTGVRLFLGIGATAPDLVGTLSQDIDIIPATINRTETDWTITGNWQASGPAGAFDPGDFLNDQAGPAAQAWINAANFSTGLNLNWIKLYPIGTTGKAIPAPPYAAGTPVLLTYTGTAPKGSGTSLLPPQVAAVQSLRTAQIGRKGRGRMFAAGIPQSALSTEGQLSATRAQSLSDTTATLLEALTFSPTVPPGPYVRPIVTGAPWTQYAQVVEIICDSVLDTQRRRTKSATATDYHTAVNP